MNIRFLLPWTLVVCWLSSDCIAQEAWLLLHEEEHDVVVKASPNGLRDVADLGDSTIYGESTRALGVLSRRNGGFLFDLIDKATGRTVVSWPTPGHAAVRLAGPSPDIVLTEAAAYFPTVRYLETPDEHPNELGGTFDLNVLSLDNGKVRVIPLPKECTAPRLHAWGPNILIHAWNGTGVWKFDARTGRLTQLVSRRDIEDTVVTNESAPRPEGNRVPTFAGYVVVPQRGVFRLSKLGTLQQILDASLQHVGSDGKKLMVGLDGRTLDVFDTTFQGKPAIGLLKETRDRKVMAFVDPVSLKSLWEAPVPAHVSPSALTISAKGRIYYIDAHEASVMHLVSTDAERIWSLRRGPSPKDFSSDRIISISDGP